MCLSRPLYLQLSTLPESVIVETTDYLCLKSQFSVLYNESMQIRTQLEDTRSLLGNLKNTHLRQIEQMEVSALLCLNSREHLKHTVLFVCYVFCPQCIFFEVRAKTAKPAGGNEVTTASLYN